MSGVLVVLGAATIAASGSSSGGAPGAKVIWVTNPIAQNQTAVLKTPAGADLSSTRSLSLCNGDGSGCEAVPLLQAWERSAKLRVPSGRAPGTVWSLRDGATELARLNEADPWNIMCHRSDSAAGATDIGDPSHCKAGASTLRLFGRGLGWAADGSCANQTSAAPGRTAVRLTPLSGGGAPLTLTASAASCYAASFALPASILPGDYAAEVKNNLAHATFSRLGAHDPTQASHQPCVGASVI